MSPITPADETTSARYPLSASTTQQLGIQAELRHGGLAYRAIGGPVPVDPFAVAEVVRTLLICSGSRLSRRQSKPPTGPGHSSTQVVTQYPLPSLDSELPLPPCSVSEVLGQFDIADNVTRAHKSAKTLTSDVIFIISAPPSFRSQPRCPMSGFGACSGPGFPRWFPPKHRRR
jgi:hypothetical protein